MFELLFFTLLQTIRISIPYILAAIGGTFSERGGVVNIGLEGIILNGAFCSILGVYYTNNPWYGVLAGVIGGVITAFIHAVCCIEYKVNHIISGIAVNIFAAGISRFFLILVFNSSSNSERIDPIGYLDIPLLGQMSPLILITIGIVFLSHIILFKSRFGLRLRSVGEHPKAADTLGINVKAMKYAGVIISGVFAGLGGVWLAMEQSQFTSGMSNGRGYIALAAMVFGRWRPLKVAGAAIIFGFAESLQIQLQVSGVNLPTQIIQMFPYIVTIIILAGIIGKSEAPAANGKHYPAEIIL